MSRRSTTILIVSISVLALVLIVGNQLGYTWAGANGIPTPVSVTLTETEGTIVERNGAEQPTTHPLRRGEYIRVDDGFAKLSIGGYTLALDARTDLELVSLNPERMEVRVGRGRVVIQGTDTEGKLTVHAGPSQATLVPSSGWVSIIHYDFLGKVEFAPVHTAISIIAEGVDGTVTADPTRYTYWASPPTLETIPFTPTEGSAAAFYKRALTD